MADVTRVAAILAGGSGTRFWPLSRAARPKPFLDLMGNGTLIQLTTQRLFPVLAPDHVFYVIGDALVPVTQQCLPGLQPHQLVTEPIARNTLGAVLLSMANVKARFGGGALAIFPSDHVVTDVARFQAVLQTAYALADKAIVTLGIEPTRPETGFGYIQASQEKPAVAHPCPGQEPVVELAVAKFVEKPNLETATAFLAQGGFYWNSGIFVFDVDFMLRHMQRAKPALAEVAANLAVELARETPSREVIRALLEPLPNINIDKAIMEESADSIVMLPSRFGWSDVGTWDALCEELPPGKSLHVGDVETYDATGNVVVAAAGAPTVALVGVEDLVVVATKDALLVTRRGKGQDVGKLVASLKEAGRTELL